MKGFVFLFLAALYGVSAQCAEVREDSVSMFVPGSYQSCSMAFVGNGEAEAKEVNFVSTEGQSAEVNGKVYKIIDASEVGLGTLYFRQEGNVHSVWMQNRRPKWPVTISNSRKGSPLQHQTVLCGR